VALAVRLGLVRTLAARDPERAATMVRDLRAQVADGVGTLRDLAGGLFPEALVERGLPDALGAAVARSTLPITIDADGVGRHPPEVEAAVYFSVLEALQNASKYSSASSVVVHIGQADGNLTFEVRDDGRGFDVEAVRAGSGLEGMGDRLAAVGGSLDVRSSPGHGTTVAGRVPVRALKPA
jgi:signal transduction histidine kinase